MLKTETVKRYIAMANEKIEEYIEHIEDCKVCISIGNSKVGNVMNVSISPIITCGINCKVCKGTCYDIKANLQYGNVLNARCRNTAMAMHDRDRYFAEIGNRMYRRRRNKVFRWHVGGDIPDYDYFCRMVENAKEHPDFIIWTYTKQYFLVNKYVKEHGGSREKAIPQNLSIMFSEWKGLDCLNPYGFPTFTCVLKGEQWPSNTHKCPGNCKICLDTKTGCPYGQSSAVDEH